MKISHRFFLLVSISMFSLAAFSAGFESSPEPSISKKQDHNYLTAKKALEAKEWQKAIGYLNKAAALDAKDPDIQNYLGYAHRNLGNYEQAFKHYEKALALDPAHRGAHEYIGEAYLKVDNLAKAEEHLGMLDKICMISCEEYNDLKKAIDAYKLQKKS